MSNSVPTSVRRSSRRASFPTPSLYGARGRKYVTQSELKRVLAAAECARDEEGLLARLVALTGARISEALALTPARCQVDESVIALVTLKRRCVSIREVPIPPGLMRELDEHFSIRGAQCDPALAKIPLWRRQRSSGWRWISRIMRTAGVLGAPACPRGLRHGFGVQSLQAGVPITLLQRWMGHANLATTAIYLDVCGAEERGFARLLWSRCDVTAANDRSAEQRAA